MMIFPSTWSVLCIILVTAAVTEANRCQCKDPLEPGPCLGSFPRFYYDTQTRSCKKFIYGGCGGNKNNFETLESCAEQCQRNETVLPCFYEADPGPCKAYIDRFYYDVDTNKCLRFKYGGCAGNHNNFELFEDCQNACIDQGVTKSTISQNVCQLPKVTGPCKGSFTRYHFDQQSKTCERFIYGGCGGNQNNFLSLADCQKACPSLIQNDDVCTLPALTGPCKAYFERFFYNTKTGGCEKFVYGGCQGNANNFNTIEDCNVKCGKKPVDPCKVEKKAGPCRAAINRYFFDQQSGRCKSFSWGGCEPNENNFLTLEACEKVCPSSDQNEDTCTLPAKSGPCDAYFERFFFNSKTGACEKFVYGGCQGNANNFNTIEDCKAKCSKKPMDPCNVEQKVGPCRAAINRYYFDKQSGKCRSFSWGGCEPNENNFLTLEACEKVCPPTTQSGNVCTLPAESGPCLAYFEKFFYNKKTGACEKFVYGGCQGNGNNFNTIEDCNAKCGKKPVDPCKVEKKAGPCRAAIKRYYFDQQSGRCRSFSWGGCEPNENNFLSLAACQKVCPRVQRTTTRTTRKTTPASSESPCNVKVQAGPCHGAFKRFFYNKAIGSCVPFTWGGCQANANNFKTLEDCEKKCVPQIANDQPATREKLCSCSA